MQAIRHVLLVLAGLVVLGLLAGPVPALWTAVALVAYTAVNRSIRLFGGARHAVAISAVLTGLSLAVLLGAVVLQFVGYGWVPAVGLVVLWLVYLGTAETAGERSRRHALELRGELLRLVREHLDRSITEDQLAARADVVLQARMGGAHFAGDAARAALTGADGLSAAEHRQLLSVLSRYLGRTERGRIPSRLHEAVREQLGNA